MAATKIAEFPATSELTRTRPAADRVLVRQFPKEEKSKGGIIYADDNKERPRKGVVIAVGKGRWLDSGEFVATGSEFKPGEIVRYGPFAGTEYPVEDYDYDEFRMMREDEILSVIEPE